MIVDHEKVNAVQLHDLQDDLICVPVTYCKARNFHIGYKFFVNLWMAYPQDLKYYTAHLQVVP